MGLAWRRRPPARDAARRAVAQLLELELEFDELFEEPLEELFDELFDEPLEELLDELLEDRLEELLDEPFELRLELEFELELEAPLLERLEPEVAAPLLELLDELLLELFDDPFDDPLDELFEELLEELFDELLLDPLLELLELEFEDRLELVLDAPERGPSERPSRCRPTAPAARFMPLSQPLKKRCTGVSPLGACCRLVRVLLLLLDELELLLEALMRSGEALASTS